MRMEAFVDEKKLRIHYAKKLEEQKLTYILRGTRVRASVCSRPGADRQSENMLGHA